jgi:hypothetical protein
MRRKGLEKIAKEERRKPIAIKVLVPSSGKSVSDDGDDGHDVATVYFHQRQQQV